MIIDRRAQMLSIELKLLGVDLIVFPCESNMKSFTRGLLGCAVSYIEGIEL